MLSVLAYHAFPSLLPGGFVGVDIFFVISGFLITSIILGGLAGTGFSYRDFYVRRIKRIFPALAIVLAATFTIGWNVLLPDEFAQLGKHAAAGAAFVSNFAFWHEAGYFDGAAGSKPLLHLWSLAIEEQFYVIWPILLCLAWKLKRSVLGIVFTVAVVSFAINISTAHSNEPAAFYSPASRFWELMVGGMLACWRQRRPLVLSAPATHAQSVAGLALIVLGLIFARGGTGFPGWWALLPTVGAYLCIASGPAALVNRYVLSARPMVWVGLISYPLYLWHWPLLSFARIIDSGTPSPWTRGVLVLVAMVLAWLTFDLVERRFRAAPVPAPGRAPAMVGSLLLIMIAIGGVGWATYANEGLNFRSQVQKTKAVSAQLVGWRYISNDRCLKRYPLRGTDAYSIWFCMASSDENPTVLLLGDSHANHLYAGFVNTPELQGQSVLSIGDCDPGWVEKSELSPEVTSYSCSGYRILDQMELINRIVSTSHSVRYVIMAGAGLNQKSSPWYVAKLRRRIDFLESQGAKVILFAPHVWLGYNPRACFGRPLAQPRESCELPVEAYREKLRDFTLTAQAIAATNPTVRVFDQNVLFCNEALCSFKKDGLPLLRDEYGHLSEFGSNQLGALFAAWARTNAPGLLELPAE